MVNCIDIVSLKCGDILGSSFFPLREHNRITFSNQNVAVVYGPNGAGKTTITRIFSRSSGTEYEVALDGRRHKTSDEDIFHVISDQLGRNVIACSAREYFLGDNIVREYELHDLIEKEFKQLFDDLLISRLASDFRVNAKSSPLVKKIAGIPLRKYVESLANKQDLGRKLNKAEFIAFLKGCTIVPVAEHDPVQMSFLLSDYSKGEASVVKVIEELQIETVKKDQDYRRLEETEVAIEILDKYGYRDECIVCDAEIDPVELSERKKAQQEQIFEALSDSTKDLMERVIQKIDGDDPLHISSIFLTAIKDGNLTGLKDLKATILQLFVAINQKMQNLFAECSSESDIVRLTDEYEEILSRKPEIADEDLKYIEQIVNENIDRVIRIDRDKNSNLKIYLDETELLNAKREDLFLSTGEQNFVSLSFEFLKAKNAIGKIVVIDDPISSFDSIYKNKIAFSILKVLSGKRLIVFTHNTDLIRLLEHQRQKSFSLYLLSKTPGEVNGFIPIAPKEVDLLLRIDKVVELLRSGVGPWIRNETYFQMALIPFMRGYARLIGRQDLYDQLTSVMHGYLDGMVDITTIYEELYGRGISFSARITISAKDLASVSITKQEILDRTELPLLDRTLFHSFVYLHLRLNVEKRLTEKFPIDTSKDYQLTDIIVAAFDGSSPESMKRRVFLTSRKTLLNEFNHFEGNINIFQPAIDISDVALEKERKNIDDFLAAL